MTDHRRRSGFTDRGDTLTTMQSQSGESHPPACWVFIRHSQCIHVRTSELSVTIEGPHRTRDCYQFDSQQDLQTFQMALAETLSEQGWLLCTSTLAE